MWQIMKNEILYTSILIIPATALVIQLTLYSITSYYENINLLVIMLFSIVMISTIIERNKTGIDRHNSLLPFKISVIGLSRAFLIVSPWLFLITGLFFINRFLFPSTFDHILKLIGQLGFLLVLINILVILNDIYLSNTARGMWERIFMVLFYFIIFTSLTIIMIMFADLIDPDLFMGKGTFIIYAWGLITSCFSILSFSKRKSFL